MQECWIQQDLVDPYVRQIADTSSGVMNSSGSIDPYVQQTANTSDVLNSSRSIDPYVRQTADTSVVMNSSGSIDPYVRQTADTNTEVLNPDGSANSLAASASTAHSSGSVNPCVGHAADSRTEGQFDDSANSNLLTSINSSSESATNNGNATEIRQIVEPAGSGAMSSSDVPVINSNTPNLISHSASQQGSEPHNPGSGNPDTLTHPGPSGVATSDNESRFRDGEGRSDQNDSPQTVVIPVSHSPGLGSTYSQTFQSLSNGLCTSR